MGIIRKTQSVKTLLNVFEQSDEAISVVGLVKQLNEKMNKTTVYRILERLEEDGILTGQVGDPILGKQAKVDALNEISDKLGITPNDAIAVGDGANDLGMLQLAGSGVALHAKPTVAAQADIKMDHSDLTALLYLQGYRKSDFVE